jgi:hypothetical protein
MPSEIKSRMTPGMCRGYVRGRGPLKPPDARPRRRSRMCLSPDGKSIFRAGRRFRRSPQTPANRRSALRAAGRAASPKRAARWAPSPGVRLPAPVGSRHSSLEAPLSSTQHSAAGLQLEGCARLRRAPASGPCSASVPGIVSPASTIASLIAWPRSHSSWQPQPCSRCQGKPRRSPWPTQNPRSDPRHPC